MSNCSLIVDDRELAVSPFLARNNVPYIINRITTGDFAIVYNNKTINRILAIFERKTLADLAQSITGSRYESQIINMLELQKKYPGCQLYYIIEGRAFPAEDDNFGRMPYSTLASAINKLEIVHGVQVLKTKDAADTAAMLARKVKGFNNYWDDISARYVSFETANPLPEWSFELMYVLKTALQYPDSTPEQLSDMVGSIYEVAKSTEHYDTYFNLIRQKNAEILDKLEKISAEWDTLIKENNINNTTNTLTENKKRSNDDIKIQMWSCLAGVSNLTAPSLNKLSLSQYVKGELTAEMLTMIKYPSGKSLHKNLVDQIVAGPDDKTELKMLKCIPGMGLKADSLLTGRRLRDIIVLSAAELAAIKIGKTNLGPAKAEIIKSIFSGPPGE
jgi:ERCC4-type nuclease